MPKGEIFFITEELQQVLDRVPETNDARSILDPFKTYILRWRRQGKSLRKIQQILRNKCKVKVHHETLRRFVKLRSKPRKAVEPEIEPATYQQSSQAATSGKRLTPDERRAQLEFIRSLNSKPVVKEQQPPSGWDLLEPDNVSFKPKGDK